MKVLSLFDGISCGMVALERAGIPVERYVAYEVDKYAIQVREKNYPQVEHCGDVFDGDYTQYKGFDLLIGGSPCQHWSIAKKGREITPDGVGGQLFMQYVRALKESGCKWFLYENNYSIHKDIKAFISEQLGVEPIMINSALVSAQQRKRCYWTNIPNVGYVEDKEVVLQDILEDGRIALQEKSYCITANEHKGSNLEHTLKKHVRTLVGVPANLERCKGLRLHYVKNGSVKLSNGWHEMNLEDGCYGFDKLTPLECERLQTLPDGYTREGKTGDTITLISSTQRYKCLGNGWTVDVIAHILGGLK